VLGNVILAEPFQVVAPVVKLEQETEPAVSVAVKVPPPDGQLMGFPFLLHWMLLVR